MSEAILWSCRSGKYSQRQRLHRDLDTHKSQLSRMSQSCRAGPDDKVLFKISLHHGPHIGGDHTISAMHICLCHECHCLCHECHRFEMIVWTLALRGWEHARSKEIVSKILVPCEGVKIAVQIYAKAVSRNTAGIMTVKQVPKSLFISAFAWSLIVYIPCIQFQIVKKG